MNTLLQSIKQTENFKLLCVIALKQLVLMNRSLLFVGLKKKFTGTIFCTIIIKLQFRTFFFPGVFLLILMFIYVL